MQERPIATISQLVVKTNISTPSVLKAIAALEKLGLVNELTKKKRNRIYSYAPYVRILSEGTQPL
jgi:Fic family protein